MDSECQYIFWMQSENILHVLPGSDRINVHAGKATHRIATMLAEHDGIKAGFPISFCMQCFKSLTSIPTSQEALSWR